ncbi:hypothetical protein EYC80_001083 [Monilinia laxa]|uniref:Uncharacterized protein n=1 Tax=Monilinia laxa TaxID=61186 RepID=A0A5N6K810_MONLA|nr:hypothetical protein EYC80_001083 [Monilinia laxa]
MKILQETERRVNESRLYDMPNYEKVKNSQQLAHGCQKTGQRGELIPFLLFQPMVLVRQPGSIKSESDINVDLKEDFSFQINSNKRRTQGYIQKTPHPVPNRIIHSVYDS